MPLHALALLLLFFAACQPAGPTDTPQPTSLVIVRQLATVGPTATPNAAQRTATQQARLIAPTQGPPTRIPSPTPYIGVYLGQALIQQVNPPFTTEQPLIAPTASGQETNPLICAIQPNPVFGTAWQDIQRAVSGLRCPIQESFGFTGNVQIFERGVMYHRPETNEVWAIIPSTFTSDGRVFYVDQPPLIPEVPLNPTAGLLVPEGVILQAWLGVVEIRQALGWAVDRQLQVDVNLQRFEGGTLFFDVTVGQTFVLLVNGVALGPLQN